METKHSLLYKQAIYEKININIEYFLLLMLCDIIIYF